jgi:hypothetical protein
MPVATLQNVGFGDWLFEMTDNPTLAQNDDSVGHLCDFIQVGRGDDHGDPLGGKLGDLAKNLAAGSDIDALRWFIEQQNLRVPPNKPTREQNLLLIAT